MSQSDIQSVEQQIADLTVQHRKLEEQSAHAMIKWIADHNPRVHRFALSNGTSPIVAFRFPLKTAYPPDGLGGSITTEGVDLEVGWVTIPELTAEVSWRVKGYQNDVIDWNWSIVRPILETAGSTDLILKIKAAMYVEIDLDEQYWRDHCDRQIKQAKQSLVDHLANIVQRRAAIR